MDAHQSYARPAPSPPSSSADPQYQQYQQQAAAPPWPPQGPWYPNHFLQYNNPSQSSSGPSPPPPPPPPGWTPPLPRPQSDYPPPPGYSAPPHPYPPHHAQLPPRPYMPPPPHLNPYPPQDWSSASYGYQQGWSHQAQSDAEDWAAKAKAWASAKAAMESQHMQADHQNQYSQAVDSQHAENYQNSNLGSAHQQYPLSAMPPNGQAVHLQENPSTGPGPVSYLPDGRMMYSAKDGPDAHLPAAQSVHQQEVPSSYSSASGKEDSRYPNEKLLPLPSSAAQQGMGHLQAPIPAADGSVFSYGNQYSDPVINPADQPLEFAPKFNRNQNLIAQSAYAHDDPTGPLRSIDPVVPMASVNTWTSSMTPDVPYPSIPSVLPPGSQRDPSISMLPAVSGHAVPSFPRFSGPGFQPTISPPGGPFGLGAGTQLPPAGGFSADSYGLPGSSERPKKAPVPNWLREEIIKTKSGITSSSLGHPKDGAQFVEDEGVDNSFDKGDQTDNKSIDSSKSTEEDEDDEDYVEAARIAAINQEIKRVLTEVLLKVTDELFDEIATKVLNEDDQATQDNHNAVPLDSMVSPTSRATPASRASAKALAVVETKDFENKDVIEKSSYTGGRNILGLANYASDDEDGEVQTSDIPNSSKIANLMTLDSKGPPLDANNAAENGTQPVKVVEPAIDVVKSEGDSPRNSLHESRNVGSDLGNDEVNGAGNMTNVSRRDELVSVNGKTVDGFVPSVSKETFDEKVIEKSKIDEEVERKPVIEVTQDVESRMRRIVTDGDGNGARSADDSSKGPENVNVDVNKKLDEKHESNDGRHLRTEKPEKYGLKETKDQGKHGEKMTESEGRRRPGHSDIKEDRNNRDGSYKDNAKDDSRRSGRSRDKEEDRSRHKDSNDLSRHKRRRSPSPGSRGRNSRDNLTTNAKDSSDEDADYSRRKSHSRRRNRSPSPIKSRRRQVSRSPHSKHSQRRHSPYSSLEGSRERGRSRSRSPSRRHR